MKSKHTKHANLAKPRLGKFARNEWAILGAPCGVIKELVQNLADFSGHRVLYIDESHDHNAEVGNVAVSTKKGEAQEILKSLDWNKNLNYSTTNDYDFVFVNGNHFKADKQIVFIDERKKESLSRKLDRLTNVRAFIHTSESREIYDFLEDESSIEIPRVSIEDISAIWKLIIEGIAVPPLRGLVLAGGRSKRMGQDKGRINYHGQGQTEYLYNLLEELGIDTSISCRSDQLSAYKALPKIEDRFLDLGPFGAIASALMSDPNSAWIVIPCDLPLLKKEDLEILIKNRNPWKFGTAFLNKNTNFPEPLISIWEPKIYQQMLTFLAQGFSCPRKVLINSEVELVEVENQDFMMNVNTPEELRKAQIILEEN